MSKQVLMVVGKFGDVPSSIRERRPSFISRLEDHPVFVTMEESEFRSMCDNQFWGYSTLHPVQVYLASLPPQLPIQITHEQAYNPPQSINSVGGYYMSSQSHMLPCMVQEPIQSHSMSTNNWEKKEKQHVGWGNYKRGWLSEKALENIHTLQQLIPYPPKSDVTSTLIDVTDYIIKLKERTQQLEYEISKIKGIHARPVVSRFPVKSVGMVNQSDVIDNFSIVRVPPYNQEDHSFGAINDPTYNPII